MIFDMCTTTALGPLARGGFWEYVSLPFFDYANKRKKFYGRSNSFLEHKLSESSSYRYLLPPSSLPSSPLFSPRPFLLLGISTKAQKRYKNTHP